jgi:hypothetical protein
MAEVNPRRIPVYPTRVPVLAGVRQFEPGVYRAKVWRELYEDDEFRRRHGINIWDRDRLKLLASAFGNVRDPLNMYLEHRTMSDPPVAMAIGGLVSEFDGVLWAVIEFRLLTPEWAGEAFSGSRMSKEYIERRQRTVNNMVVSRELGSVSINITQSEAEDLIVEVSIVSRPGLSGADIMMSKRFSSASSSGHCTIATIYKSSTSE